MRYYQSEAVETKDIKEGKIPTEKFRPKAKFAWSAGIAISRFLEELKNGKIIATTCSKCGRIMVPPRIYCEKCFKPADGWKYVKDTGVINTFSVSFLAADASRLKEPIVVAIINLDGASEGMGIVHRIEEYGDWREVKIGMKVKAVWKPPEERTGAITDIAYFKPIRE
ncbi:MAG: Zn-ribbon domain-containing OB-fold protein [Candidatus Bathyarchaeota archaeon]|nr:Zn-ribbon domain-containing OB-fold protein [Candidatus Bathyarchaeota archaeon]MDI6805306.1 Zn-ribbon domain-containing OB-fold protein [Candidatus Bathyarchaeia archaeon]